MTGSKITGSRPAAASSSVVSAYRKVKARPPATATTGRVSPLPVAAREARSGPTGTRRAGEPGTRSTAPGSGRRARRSDRPTGPARPSASGRSAAGTRPRCRDGASMPASRGSTPRTGIPVASRAATTSSEWRTDPALFKITPEMRVSGSKVCRPCTQAAAVRDTWEMSSTSTTGAAITRATCAVEAQPSAPMRPSKSPITPSTTATSAGVGTAQPCSSSGTSWSSPHRNGSRLRPGRPVARAW